MAGQADYLVHVMCDDVADYERIHRQQLATLPHVAQMRSSFAIRQVCHRTDFEVPVRTSRSGRGEERRPKGRPT